MTILITGATGLIGSKIIELLTNQYEIHFFTTQKNYVSKTKAKSFYWNPDEGYLDPKAFQGVEAIIHLVGANIAKRWTGNYRKEILDSRIKTTNLIFEFLKNNPHSVKQIVSASGTAIYPDSKSTLYFENETNSDKTFLGNIVIEWEKAVDKFTEIHIKVAKLRTGIVLDKSQGALPEMTKPVKLGFGATFGNGSQTQPWIHITDIARIYIYAIEHSLEGVYNAVAPELISNKKLTSAIAKKLNKSLWLPGIPYWIMKLTIGEMASILFNDKKISCKKLEAKGFEFQYNTIEKALEDIFK